MNTIDTTVETRAASPAETAAHTSRTRRYVTLGGSWGAWLFDALDATIFGFVILAVAHTFNATLSDVVSTVAWFLLATGIGGFFLGNVSDRIGRKRTLLMSVLIYATGTLLCGFASSIAELNVYRFAVGIGVGGLWSAAVALVGELWPASGRAKAIAVMQTGWSGGSLLAAIFAWTLLDAANPDSWRRLFILSSIPAYCIAVFILVFVKESPVWLANRAFIRQNAQRAGLLQIFRPPFLRTTLLALSISILGMYGYWIITTFTPTYLQSILHVRIDQAPVFLVWTGIGATLGYLAYGSLAERFGRRHAFAGFFVGVAIAVPLFAYGATMIPLTDGKFDFSTRNVALIGSLSALLGFFTGYFSGFGAWYAELFPTSVRSTAAGFCFNFGRVGAIGGIKLVPVLIPLIGFTKTYCVASIAYLCAALLVFTLRETQGVELTSGN
ncbi:MFS transporter [Paraburkholderia caballeronis]|uniref:Major Facilitator Superfamily protein n=1 Tax=Paraburkholderia caballeronis TaxID=416943 RepID=A0A1H7SSM9_9BURK|nr:MFS transporter [Paraburkholderia caballeronis]PXW25623.1 MFS transporter [Paraburkholderia caballeronis]PXX01230.1 MFS transporter [Paraburkholderia caballeronis]RAJ99417.1 MFS transporter [Paraburkholderia caballeronis]TDV25569.1 MFS transporter [Paraburkholderia caballeronis]SEE29761.1 Major Facilitator Superfamily protein [Paraburkholderia caballeronis]